MVLEEPDQLVICYLMLLQSGHPLLGTLVNLLSSPSTSPKHLTGYSMRHCFLNFLPLGFLPLSVLFCSAIFQTDPYQLLMDLSLFCNISLVVLLLLLEPWKRRSTELLWGLPSINQARPRPLPGLTREIPSQVCGDVWAIEKMKCIMLCHLTKRAGWGRMSDRVYTIKVG